MNELWIGRTIGASETELRVPVACILAMDTLCYLADGLEVGGMLLGSYRDRSCVEISEATPPPFDSECTATTFQRGKQGLKMLLEIRFPETYMVGEWHLHPIQDAPEPSDADLQQMAENAEDAKVPQILILCGTPKGGSGFLARNFRAYEIHANRYAEYVRVGS